MAHVGVCLGTTREITKAYSQAVLQSLLNCLISSTSEVGYSGVFRVGGSIDEEGSVSSGQGMAGTGEVLWDL